MRRAMIRRASTAHEPTASIALRIIQHCVASSSGKMSAHGPWGSSACSLVTLPVRALDPPQYIPQTKSRNTTLPSTDVLYALSFRNSVPPWRFSWASASWHRILMCGHSHYELTQSALGLLGDSRQRIKLISPRLDIWRHSSRFHRKSYPASSGGEDPYTLTFARSRYTCAWMAPASAWLDDGALKSIKSTISQGRSSAVIARLSLKSSPWFSDVTSLS